MDLHYKKTLEKRKSQGILRKLKYVDGKVDFSSNDYLSLNQDENWLAFLKKEIPENLWFQSLSSSRLVSGNNKQKEEVESFFAQFYQAESSLFFNCGYSANLSIFSTLPGKNDTVIYDSDIHASIRDGLKMAICKSFNFKHNSLEDLENKLIRTKGQVYVAVESVYSMDGKKSPLLEIVELCEKYGALLIVDEAHSTGLFGNQGKGLCYELGIADRVFIRLMTFGKAIASHGAVLLCSEDLRQFFVNFARPFIYSTSPSTFEFLKAQKSVEFIAENPNLTSQLQEKITWFNSIVFPVENCDNRMPIIPFYNHSIEKLKSFEDLGIKNNFQFKTILPPTVAKGSECIRFSLQRLMNKEDLLKVGNLLKSHFDLL